MSTQYVYEYPRPAVTVDIAAVSRDRRILLIRRKAEPFKDRWALPGGFINIDETLQNAAARELAEETGIRGLDLRQLRAFDKPDRDPRGRTIAVAFLAEVNDPPSPTAGDDAAESAWFPMDRLPPLAFDHEDIVAHARRALAHVTG